ncbi:signal peptide peptidase-like 2B isoform X7 [Rhinopithecus roxellana]|uniref:signal peptide peptidase-like 2B isoform X7 n=1 Tax=Rhinopithecus roxellana TaxID=61622 RepID=UPI0012379B47|nr:signal peptide peptidase-like 2B isoform X7 [Rhinopithecus roxellana]
MECRNSLTALPVALGCPRQCCSLSLATRGGLGQGLRAEARAGRAEPRVSSPSARAAAIERGPQWVWGSRWPRGQAWAVTSVTQDACVRLESPTAGGGIGSLRPGALLSSEEGLMPLGLPVLGSSWEAGGCQVQRRSRQAPPAWPEPRVRVPGEEANGHRAGGPPIAAGDACRSLLWAPRSPRGAIRRNLMRLAFLWPCSATKTCWTSSGQRFGRMVRVALYAPHEPVLDYNMVIIFIMAVGTVAIGGYWAGSRDVKKRYMKHKREDGPEKQEDEAVDVTPVMTCVFVVMCCSMLVLLYYFYDFLVYVVIGIFCLASATGLYSCLAPCVRRLPFGKCRIPNNSLPYFHKRPQARMLLLALFCVAVSVVWGVFRNEDQWAWVLQDALGIAFCLYMLKTIRLPTFKACTLLLLVLFLYDIFFVFITPFLTKSGSSIMVEVATGPSDSATREKLPMVLKVPRLNSSPLALCDRPFSLLGFGDILVPESWQPCPEQACDLSVK